jgi:hypothetical protein
MPQKQLSWSRWHSPGWSLPVGHELAAGQVARGSGGEELGTGEHVLQVPELDVFDGIVVTTAGGLRFADAGQMADITDRHVLLNLGRGRRTARATSRRRWSTRPTL